MSKSDELMLITSHVELVETKPSEEEGGEPIVEIDDIKSQKDLHSLFDVYVPLDAEEILVDAYNKYFEKYNPVFKNECECEHCKHDFDFPVDIEMALFKRFLGE